MKNKIFITIFAVFATILTAILLVSCGVKKDTDKKKVVTTAWFSYDIAKQIGKDKLSIEMAYPYSTSVHDLEPNANVFVKIKDADLLITTSKFVDANLIGENADKSHLPNQENILDLFSQLFPNFNLNNHHHHHENESHEGHNHENESHEGHDHSSENNHHHHDDEEDAHRIEHIKQHAYFHYWTSIENIINSAKIITERFIKLDNANKDFYNNNLKEFEKNYTLVKNDFKTYLTGKKVEPILYVGHDSIGAFMIEFDLVSKYIPFDINIDDHNEATAQMKKAFIDELNEHNLKVIFVPEMNEKEKEAKAILEEVNKNKQENEMVKSFEFHGFHNISEDVYNSKSLIDLFKQNIENLKQLIK